MGRKMQLKEILIRKELIEKNEAFSRLYTTFAIMLGFRSELYSTPF
jgi:hypothetical protein